MKFEQTRYDLGAERYLATGEVLPDSVLAEIREHDAILLGAVGGKPNDPNLPPGILERGLLLRLRFELDHYVNLRPSRIFPGVASPLADPGEVDFVVVREGTEGPYTGNGGALRVGTPHEIATEVSVNTAYGVERVVRDAFARAQRRPRKQAHPGPQDQRAGQRRRASGGGSSQAVAPEFPDVTVDYIHIDAAMIFMTTDPARFDVIVTDNLFGDIITDLAAAITGGIGLAASGNVNPDRTAPSMFEPVHGSAPDIAGQQKADPTAAILSASLLLDHLGYADAAAAVETRGHRRPGRPQYRARSAVPPRSATRSPHASPASRSAGRQRLDPVEDQPQAELELVTGKLARFPVVERPGGQHLAQPRHRGRVQQLTKLIGPTGARLDVGELEGHQHVLPSEPVQRAAGPTRPGCSASPDGA